MVFKSSIFRFFKRSPLLIARKNVQLDTFLQEIYVKRYVSDTSEKQERNIIYIIRRSSKKEPANE